MALVTTFGVDLESLNAMTSVLLEIKENLHYNISMTYIKHTKRYVLAAC